MSDGGGTEENSGTMEVSAVQTVADTSVLQKHIRKLVPLLLEDGGEAPASLETALEEKSAVEQMRKFLADPQIHTILVERSALKGTFGKKLANAIWIKWLLSVPLVWTQLVCHVSYNIRHQRNVFKPNITKLTAYVSKLALFDSRLDNDVNLACYLHSWQC